MINPRRVNRLNRSTIRIRHIQLNRTRTRRVRLRMDIHNITSQLIRLTSSRCQRTTSTANINLVIDRDARVIIQTVNLNQYLARVRFKMPSIRNNINNICTNRAPTPYNALFTRDYSLRVITFTLRIRHNV